MEVSWRLAVTMFSVHIEILLWYGMFRVAEMRLISTAFRFVRRGDRAKKKALATAIAKAPMSIYFFYFRSMSFIQ